MRRWSRPRFVAVLGLDLAVLTAGVALTLAVRPSPSSASSPGPPKNIYVNPSTGGNIGGSRSRPYKTIQDALNVARPGSVIHLSKGIYQEEPETKVDGTAAHPIVVEGPEHGMSISGRYKAVLYGVGHVFSVQNNDYILRGFTIDGQQLVEHHRPLATWPTNASAIFDFKQSVQPYVKDSHLIVVDGGIQKAVTGTVIDDMFINGGAGECVRFRDGANRAVVENSVIQYCGLEGKSVADTYEYHNGEGVYIGTSPKSTQETRSADDPTNHITVKDDRITTFGSECVDIKENSFDNSVISVHCGDNQEPLSYDGSNLELRGHNNTVENNVIFNSRGYGVKIASDSSKYKNSSNTVEGNTFSGQKGAAIVIQSHTTQGPMCGNRYASGQPFLMFGMACPPAQ
jgi:hypothetical protein